MKIDQTCWYFSFCVIPFTDQGRLVRYVLGLSWHSWSPRNDGYYPLLTIIKGYKPIIKGITLLISTMIDPPLSHINGYKPIINAIINAIINGLTIRTLLTTIIGNHYN